MFCQIRYVFGSISQIFPKIERMTDISGNLIPYLGNGYFVMINSLLEILCELCFFMLHVACNDYVWGGIVIGPNRKADILCEWTDGNYYSCVSISHLWILFFDLRAVFIGQQYHSHKHQIRSESLYCSHIHSQKAQPSISSFSRISN
jgi:hypothetical protein